MMKKACRLLVLFNVLCAIHNFAVAQTPNLSTHNSAVEASKAEESLPVKSNSELAREIEALRHRVEDLESQNRALAELLNAVKTKLAALPDPAPPDERRAARVQPVAAALPRASTIPTCRCDGRSSPRMMMRIASGAVAPRAISSSPFSP